MAGKVKRKPGAYARTLKNIKKIQQSTIVVGYRGNETSDSDYTIGRGGRSVTLSKAGENLAERFAYNAERWPTLPNAVTNTLAGPEVQRVVANLATDGAQRWVKRIPSIARSELQQEIVNVRSPANKMSTIKRKGTSNPLISSSHMKNAATAWVKGK